MKKLIIFLLVGSALLFGAASCMADALEEVADVFEVTEDGQRIQIATVLTEGTEYEILERFATPEGSAFDSYFYGSTPIEWVKIAYQDREGHTQQGWMVANPDVIAGIKMDVFENHTSEEYNGYDHEIQEEYNGYDGFFVLCESLSLRENPQTTSNTLATLAYGTYGAIIGENEFWHHVVYRNEQGQRLSGWVKKDYILVNPQYFIPREETPVYAIPSHNSKRVGLISGETSYPIIGELDGFLAISLRGASGFVIKP